MAIMEKRRPSSVCYNQNRWPKFLVRRRFHVFDKLLRIFRAIYQLG